MSVYSLPNHIDSVGDKVDLVLAELFVIRQWIAEQGGPPFESVEVPESSPVAESGETEST